VGVLVVAGVALAPLLLEPRPVRFIGLLPTASVTGPKVCVALALLLPIGLWLWADRRALQRPALVGCALLVLAGAMTAVHAFTVDFAYVTIPVPTADGGPPHPQTIPYAAVWQRHLYLAVFNNSAQPCLGAGTLPHIYRPLPYGFTRVLEWASTDWWFSCLAYRCFFNFWFLWATYRFVLRYTGPARAWLGVGLLVALYPFSLAYYWGQLTDPMSHALLTLGLIYIVEDNLPGLFVAVVVGVLAKETAGLLVVAYLAVHWRKGLPAFAKAAVVGVGAVAAFLATRLPLGWRPGSSPLHSISGFMVTANLGVGTPVAPTTVPLLQRYFHLFLFTLVFVPFIVLRWRRTDPQLKALYLSLAPLIFLSSLCFSWMHEPRNFVPLLPIEAAIILAPAAPVVAARKAGQPVAAGSVG
jgi:hypothetical protein